MRTRIMYIEDKSDLVGPARIGRVAFSKTGRTLSYRGFSFLATGGWYLKANYVCLETGVPYWISGPRRDGRDHLYGKADRFEVDADVADEYWREIRTQRPASGERAHAERANYRRPHR